MQTRLCDDVGVCDDGDKTGGVDDGASGAVDGVDIRGVQAATNVDGCLL